MQAEVKSLLALTGRLPSNTAIPLAVGYAPVAKLADALDLKSSGYLTVWVRTPPGALRRRYLRNKVGQKAPR